MNFQKYGLIICIFVLIDKKIIDIVGRFIVAKTSEYYEYLLRTYFIQIVYIFKIHVFIMIEVMKMIKITKVYI